MIKITENKKNELIITEYMNIQEIIKLLADVRTDLYLLKKNLNLFEIEEIKEALKYKITDIDLIGCELSQNIAKKLLKNKE